MEINTTKQIVAERTCALLSRDANGVVCISVRHSIFRFSRIFVYAVILFSQLSEIVQLDSYS